MIRLGKIQSTRRSNWGSAVNGSVTDLYMSSIGGFDDVGSLQQAERENRRSIECYLPFQRWHTLWPRDEQIYARNNPVRSRGSNERDGFTHNWDYRNVHLKNESRASDQEGSSR
jgi:hypothetical protein